MRYYHDQHIGVYENAIPDRWCDDVINFFEDNINVTEIRQKETGSEKGIRDTQSFLFNKELVDEFHIHFNKLFALYSYKYLNVPQSLVIDAYKLQKTLPTEGFHPYHIEHDSSSPSIYRVGVYTVYLNNVEEGGETEFLYQLKRIKPKKGTIVIFPAGYTHVHRGNTPLTGEKYIMTGWLEFPNKKDIGS